MTTFAISYPVGPTALSITLASLATSSTFLAGRSSAQIDNTADLLVDAAVEGLITVGTTPTVNTSIQVYAVGSMQDMTSVGKDTLVGTDAAKTLTSAGVRDAMLRLAAWASVDATTSDRGYYFAPVSIAGLFGFMPKYWGLFVTHNTAVNLNATSGNHWFKYTGIKNTAS